MVQVLPILISLAQGLIEYSVSIDWINWESHQYLVHRSDRETFYLVLDKLVDFLLTREPILYVEYDIYNKG